MKFNEYVEESLDDAFPFLDFTNTDPEHEDDDERFDTIQKGLDRFVDSLHAYQEYSSYGTPDQLGYGRDTSELDELKRQLREAEHERDLYQSALGRRIPPAQGLPHINRQGKVVYNEEGWGSEHVL